MIQPAKAIGAADYIIVIRGQGALMNSPCTQVQFFSLVVVSLCLIQSGKAPQTYCCLGVLRPPLLLVQSYGFFEEWLSRLIAILISIESCQVTAIFRDAKCNLRTPRLRLLPT